MNIAMKYSNRKLTFKEKFKKFFKDFFKSSKKNAFDEINEILIQELEQIRTRPQETSILFTDRAPAPMELRDGYPNSVTGLNLSRNRGPAPPVTIHNTAQARQVFGEPNQDSRNLFEAGIYTSFNSRS